MNHVDTLTIVVIVLCSKNNGFFVINKSIGYSGSTKASRLVMKIMAMKATVPLLGILLYSDLFTCLRECIRVDNMKNVAIDLSCNNLGPFIIKQSVCRS